MACHGTASYTSGQFVEASIAVLRALPKALEGTNPKTVLTELQKRGEVLERVLRSAIKQVLDTGVFFIVLEGNKTASQLLWAGKYKDVWADYWGATAENARDWFTPERFPLSKHSSVRRKIELVPLDHKMDTKEVLAKLDGMGLKRPTYEDALYFGVQQPGEQLKHRIVFLHEPVRTPVGAEQIIVLGETTNGEERTIGLYYFDRRWNACHVFAAVSN